jgi:hypothetical protein
VLLNGYGAEHSPLLKSREDAIWPYFAEHPQILEQAWQKKEGFDYWHDSRRRGVFKVLATFPQLPPAYVRMLWDIAFNGSKKERPLAQKALANVPGKEQRILASLTAGKAEHRAIAAEWLGELGCKEARPELHKALKKEKNDLAAGAMMLALERLGVPLDEFVSMDGLLKEAKALIAKGIPKDLAWFKFENLPKVRWAKDGKAVKAEILQWMILQSNKLGSPDPSPRLRQYVSYLNRSDAEEFGQYILQAWMEQDLTPPSHDDAEAYAKQHAAQMAAMVQKYPQYYQPPAQGWHQHFYQIRINQPMGSATKEKGVLAVAAACCGGRAAGPIQRYLKTWYGMRVHQCKALIAVLSWIDHPSAIQVLLSVAARFRTASLRKEAEVHVNEVAERKGWTLDELADRTIPTAGFDEKREMVIDYGTRKFLAKVDNDLEIGLTSEEGKAIKALPDPRQDEDAEKIKTLKKEFSAAKKELQGVVKLQRERLYEAMCTQRTWSFADWNTLLASHPIVGSYCQRLIWAVREQERITRTFRPLGDGTFTDASDEPVELKADERICLAHQCLLPREAAEAWQQHFADYEIQPLFQQLGQVTYSLAETDRQNTQVTAFKGHMLEAFKLRGILTKRGYTRGQAQDGGWFYEYHKLFPGQGLQVTIEFSGNGLPEENRKVALVELHFARTSGSEERMTYWSGSSGLPLSEVPPVLLSECYNDLRMAAGEGTGFDAEWEKKAFM